MVEGVAEKMTGQVPMLSVTHSPDTLHFILRLQLEREGGREGGRGEREIKERKEKGKDGGREAGREEGMERGREVGRKINGNTLDTKKELHQKYLL